MRPPPSYAWRDRDAALRFRDAIAIHQMALSRDEILAGRWIVVRLSDGSSDGQTYTSQAEAMRYAPGLESLFAYFRLTVEQVPAQACDVLLWYCRVAYDNGYRPDPGRPDVGLILPTPEQLRRNGLR